MPLKVQTIDQAIEFSGIKACVYGLAGCGKTMLCASMNQPTIMLSAESGLLSLAQLTPEAKALIQVIQIKSITDMWQAFTWLQSEKQAEWLAIDSISEIAEVVLGVSKADVKDPRQAYGKMADDMMALIRGLRDIHHYNVIMTAKMTTMVDEHTGITRLVPMLPGRQLTPQLPYMFDEMFALRVEPQPTTEDPQAVMRVIQTGRDIMYDCKDRSGALAMFEPASMEHIASKIHAFIQQQPISQPVTQ